MAGSITVSSITLDSDNNFSIKSNTGATLFFANTSGVDVANSIGATAITSDKILSIANTKISGLVTASQIANVANTQLTGTLIASQIASVNATTATSGTLPTARLPSGTVLQVVQGSFQSTVTTTSTTPVATGLTATITPTSATSKILVTVFGSLEQVTSGTTNIYPLYKNGSNLITTFMIWSLAVGDGVALSASYLDSPATTSATTYALFFRTESGGYTASFGSATTAGNYLNTITLTEIAA